MPELEFEFNQQDRELIVSQNPATLNGFMDYVRLTIYPMEAIDNVVVLPDSDKQAIFYSSLSENSFKINISPFGEGEVGELRKKTIGGTDNNDFQIYKNDNDIYIKPNEIFNTFELPQGDYKIQIDFLNQLSPNSIVELDTSQQQQGAGGGDVDEETNQQTQENIADVHYQFIIKQISTSRKEIRLKLLNTNITNNSQLIEHITNQLNHGLDKYQFKHFLNIGTGDHIPIMNFTFDRITDGRDNQSIILKLYEPLPTNIRNLSMVTIEREVLTTQIQEIFYFSDVPDVFFGDGLLPDEQENWINPDDNDIGFQNLNDLAISSSIGDVEIDTLISSSQYAYPNLNTDYNDFSNHTFFGSAKKKLQNFKTKIETIQSYYSDISSSLSVSSSIQGDSNFVIQKRKNLFDKITKEIKEFTPYERFLYFDGQQESTASAPGLGKNYADTVPVTLSGEGISLGPSDGFNSVYKHSSEKVSGVHNQFVDLFTGKYKVHEKPFFNYSGSIYLSFLMIADSGSALRYINNNKSLNNGLDMFLPQDTKFQNNILNPDMTGSAYQRYIFEASQSYFIPNTTGNDMSDLIESDFNAGSSKFTILHGNVKTGSYQIKDSTGMYPKTVFTQSGVPFFGSILPAGELFRINYINELSSSLSGYLNLDSQTSGAAVTNAMLTDFSGNDNTGSIEGTPTISDGYISGKSFLFQSESNEGVRFFSDDDFNYSRDDNFSLSVWAKRFHPNTGSADPGAGTGAQPIFTRGAQKTSYGIDYDFVNNRIRAGVRPDGAIIKASFTVTDDLLEWNHLVFTFESGSTTGIKLYVNGELKDTESTTGTGYRVTGSNNFTSSVDSINTETDVLSIGGNNVLGGSSRYYNGFIQYPRVYSRTLTASQVNQLYLNPDGIMETKITDVKVTFNNPTNVLPFDNLYHTSSTEWTTWYNNTLAAAENFDTNNIHSFENNLPLYIQESSEFNDMKDFLSLQGEQYDLIRNHIDSMGTLHKRGYKKTNSPPNNTLPMLLSNMGWQAINPFTGSLTDTLGSYLTGVTTIDDIKNNTWRKTLNNLLYIYKSKGTKNAVRGLLNVYGYPPDVINFDEFGGSTEESNPRIFTNIPPTNTGIDLSLDTSTGSFSFTTNRQKLYNYRINGNNERVLVAEHYRNDAPVNTIEFVYKHVKSTKDQQLITKAAHATNDTELFDLRLVPSSDGASSSFEFRLNNSNTGSLEIADNAVSMSTNFIKVSDGQLWNVMLQRMTSSISGTGIQEYRLHTALQEGNFIKTYNYVTMSVSGGITNAYVTSSDVMTGSEAGRGYFANQNWPGTGSYGTAVNLGNLHFGGRSTPQVAATNPEMTGSLAEVRGWSSALSMSKFRQHVLNKFSTVGNTLDSHKDELVYHFKLNENYSSGSITSSGQTLPLVDSSPTTTYSNFSYTPAVPGFFTGSNTYGFDIIDTVKLTLQDNSQKLNDNKIIISPEQSAFNNLNPFKPAVESLTKPVGKKPKVITSDRLEIYRSPQSFVDDFILDKLSGFNLEKLYGDPRNYYSQSYGEFDTFRENFFKAHPIEVDVNKFIRAHENMFNHSIIEGLKSIVPARSTFSDKNANFGVEIKPTILEKQKFEYEEHSIEANPNTGIGTIDVESITHIPTSTFESIKEGVTSHQLTSSGTFESPKSASISVITVESVISDSSVVSPKSGSITSAPSLSDSSVPTSKDGTIDYASTANQSYTSIHTNWGTSSSDVQFINFAADTGSDGTFNTYHIDTRFVFHTVGEHEYYSASMGKSSNFDDASKFYNRLYITDDFHSSVTYDSKNFGTGSGVVTGRMMGKTRYFFTGSDGNIVLPPNHINNFSYPFKERMIDGTQNTNPGFLNGRYEDYSSASFYRVKVTGGDNQIRIQSGNPGIGSDDKIIYDDNSGGGGNL